MLLQTWILSIKNKIIVSLHKKLYSSKSLLKSSWIKVHLIRFLKSKQYLAEISFKQEMNKEFMQNWSQLACIL